MHDYDVALKRILTRPGSALLRALTGASRLRWLNVELPRVNNLRLDLLGETPAGKLIQIELQSRNEKHFEIRMGEYLFAIARRFGRVPMQVVLYVGHARLSLKNRIEEEGLSYGFHVVDIRDLDGERLLASPHLSDNVISILTRLGSEPGAVRKILERISKGPEAERVEALTELSILAGLRRLSGEVQREAINMPIHESIMDNEIFGPRIREGIRQGLKQGLEKGLEKGLEQGRIEGQREVLLGQIKKRFGAVPPRIRKRVASLDPHQLKAATLRILDAKKPEDLFAE